MEKYLSYYYYYYYYYFTLDSLDHEGQKQKLKL